METKAPGLTRPALIRTPDQRLRIFVSSTLKELADEREAVSRAVIRLHLSPVMFESGARPHPAQDLYRAYLSQSHIFIGIYWQSYGWVAPGEQISGLEEEYNLSSNMPRLLYIKNQSGEREPGLQNLLERIRYENFGCYKYFDSPDELQELVENDLILLLTEFFETAQGISEALDDSTQLSLTNVPFPRNSLVGREHELATAINLLTSDDVSLVTLTGPAGAGKSRLGIQIALELRDHFPDGVYLVGLESISDPVQVVPAIARTLGITEIPGDPPLFESLKTYLNDRRTLLLLDNFEQILDAAPKISELLEACQLVKLLVTSRAPLHLRAEIVFPVLPLAVTELKGETNLQVLIQYSAVQLFLQRARGVKPDFQVTSDNVRAVVEICHKLDGLPLAIELASARANMLPPQMLLNRLEHRFDLLRGGTRDLPERQHTLLSAIDWSFNLLDQQQKSLFRRLAVFAGGWTFEASESVCAGGELLPIEIADVLESLVDNNLIKPPVEVNGELRMSMFESIREYAREMLAHSDEEERAMLRKHAEYYLEMAEQASPELRGKNQLVWLGRLEMERYNIRAALNNCLEMGMLETTLRFGAALWRFAAARGYISEGRRWLEAALAQLNNSNDDSIAPSVRASALEGAGAMARIQGDLCQARTYHQSALELRRQSVDKGAVGRSLNSMGIVLMFCGEYQEAQQLLEESLKLARASGNEIDIEFALNNLGIVEMYLSNFDRALQLHEETLQIIRQREDKHGIGGALGNMGDVLRLQGKFGRASNVLQDSLDLMVEIDDKQGMAITLGSLGRLALDMGNADKCEKHYLEALPLLRAVDDRIAITDALEALAAASCAIAIDRKNKKSFGNLLRATILCSAAERLRQAICAPLPPTDKSTYEHTLAVLKHHLDQAKFSQAWEQGQEMTISQAIEFALAHS